MSKQENYLVLDNVVGLYCGPQLSQQQQITHSNNKLITTTTKTSHQTQIAHRANKIMLTAQKKILTAQTKTLTAPPNRGVYYASFQI